jgi:hypothetical protein
MRLGQRHPVRAAVAGLTTCGAGTYWESKQAAYDAVAAVCRANHLRLEVCDLAGGDGYETLTLRPIESNGIVCECCEARMDDAVYENRVVFSWYVLSHDCVELVSYVS